MVVAADTDMLSEMSDTLRYKIGELMGMSGQFFRTGDVHSLRLEEVQFEGLALSYAEFVKKTYYLGNEIAVALFHIQTAAKIGNSPEMGWVSTSLNEISPNDPVDFDLYIFLPMNKKFILYRRAGTVMEEHQKVSLENNGINEIHLKRENIPDFELYRTKTHLNALVATYRMDSTEVTAA